MEFLSDIASLINSTLRISTPLVFAAMAGIFAERSGVIDFSLEGKMLMAAFVAAVGSYFLGNPWLGLLLAIIACVSLSMLHGFASVTYKGDQVVSCVAINILIIGLTTALAAAWFGQDLRSSQTLASSLRWPLSQPWHSLIGCDRFLVPNTLSRGRLEPIPGFSPWGPSISGAGCVCL